MHGLQAPTYIRTRLQGTMFYLHLGAGKCFLKRTNAQLNDIHTYMYMYVCIYIYIYIGCTYYIHVSSAWQDSTGNKTEPGLLALPTPQGLGGFSNAIASPPNMQLTFLEQRGNAAWVASIIGLTHMHSTKYPFFLA